MDTDLLRFAPPQARALVGVNRATWHRWISGTSRVPVAAINLLRIVVGGELPHTDWDGWRLRDGKLFDPSGQWHTPSTITAWHWARQELQAARREENQSAGAGGNVVIFPGRRSAANITAELNRQLDQGGR